MSLIQTNWKPDAVQLRQFGVICFIALPLVGWFWGAGWSVMGLLVVAGLAMAVAGGLRRNG